MQLLKLAFRNIGRNKRRTLITAASIMFAVFFAIVVSSIQEGTWNHMVEGVVKYHFGYAQIHKQGYWDEQTIDNVFDPSEAELQIGDDLTLVPRLESFSLISTGPKTKGALVIGIDPDRENQLTNIQSRLTKGSFFSENDQSTLISEGLAEYLNVDVNDTVVLISQGYHGTNAAGKYVVSGLVKFGSPELNQRMLYLPMGTARQFYGTGEKVTALVLDVNQGALPRAKEMALTELDQNEYEIMDYEEMLPELIQAKELDTASSNIILAVLYLIIGFGIFGTILMMLKEREYEMGILKAIGMKSHQINWVVWSETMILGIIGCIAGILLAAPLVGYFFANPIQLGGDYAAAYEKFGVEPIIKVSIHPSLFINQAIVVFGMISFLSLFAINKIRRLDPVSAMRAH